MPLAQLARVLQPAADGSLVQPQDGQATLGRAASRKDTVRRVAAGGAAHEAAPDVRRTPNLSEEKRIAAQRIAHDLLERVTTLMRPRPRLPRRSTAARRRSRPASCSACGWRRRSARTCSAWSTCSTSPRPACIRPTAKRCCVALDRLKRVGQLAVRGRARPGRDAPRRLAGRRRPRCRRAGRARALQRPARRAARTWRRRTPRATCSPKPAPRLKPPRTPKGWLQLEGITRNNLHGAGRRLPARRASPR